MFAAYFDIEFNVMIAFKWRFEKKKIKISFHFEFSCQQDYYEIFKRRSLRFKSFSDYWIQGFFSR